MPKSGITFRVEDNLNFSLEKKAKIKNWIQEVLKQEGKATGNILYIFCTDGFLLKINRQFLKHDFFTDIITFDYSDKKEVSGEIYISIDRVKENARTFKQDFQKELMRTIIHGILHLCGYKDKNPVDKKIMKLKEEQALLTINDELSIT